MKKIIWCAVMLISMAQVAEAQQKKAKKANAAKNKAAAKADKNTSNKKQDSKTVVLSSTSSYQARAGIGLSNTNTNRSSGTLRIADPVINAFNAKAKGETDIPNTVIMGVPKHAFGFKNGKIRLSATGSTSSGGTTGLGGVGTGNNLGAIGANSSMLTTNGKNPEAGSAMWGNSRNLVIRKD